MDTPVKKWIIREFDLVNRILAAIKKFMPKDPMEIINAKDKIQNFQVIKRLIND